MTYEPLLSNIPEIKLPPVDLPPRHGLELRALNFMTPVVQRPCMIVPRIDIPDMLPTARRLAEIGEKVQHILRNALVGMVEFFYQYVDNYLSTLEAYGCALYSPHTEDMYHRWRYWRERERRLHRPGFDDRLKDEKGTVYHGATGIDQRFSKWRMARARKRELAAELFKLLMEIRGDFVG